ncbi:hypothetical protein SUDANB150_00416 [Streptomyces sp. enrichment culture]
MPGRRARARLSGSFGAASGAGRAESAAGAVPAGMVAEADAVAVLQQGPARSGKGWEPGPVLRQAGMLSSAIGSEVGCFEPPAGSTVMPTPAAPSTAPSISTA